MEDLNLRISGEDAEDWSERITGWLNELALEGLAQEKVEPVTPLRRQYIQHQLCDELSPTDTTFSGTSGFDKSQRCNVLDTPSREVRCYDNVSDTACEDEEEESRKPIRQLKFNPDIVKTASSSCDQVSELKHEPVHDAYVSSPHGPTKPASLTSCDPDSKVEANTRPTEPRFTIILSCLQCTLSSLPCSRTLPACKRCARGTSPSTCIMLRRRYDEEMGFSSTLKLRDEDLEVWDAKMRMREKLRAEWQEKKDREDWVMPRIDLAVRGKYRKDDRYVVEKWGIGDGRGPTRWEYLCLDWEVILV
jgi:hypothetical protein